MLRQLLQILSRRPLGLVCSFLAAFFSMYVKRVWPDLLPLVHLQCSVQLGTAFKDTDTEMQEVWLALMPNLACSENQGLKHSVV